MRILQGLSTIPADGRAHRRPRARARNMIVRALQVRETAAGANGVDMPLGQDRAQPGLQRASPMKITKERAAIGSFAYPIELRKQRVCEFARRRRVARAAQNSAGRRTQVAAKTLDEVIPRLGAAFGTRASKRQIPKVERGNIFLKLGGVRRFFAKAFPGADFHSGGKHISLQPPRSGPG